MDWLGVLTAIGVVVGLYASVRGRKLLLLGRWDGMLPGRVLELPSRFFDAFPADARVVERFQNGR